MSFQYIDRTQWPREPYFSHFTQGVPCTYSMTVKLDITRLRASGKKLYPALLHCIASVVNRHEEFRTALDEQGRLGVYDVLFPCYTVFHKDTETFSNIWTEYFSDYPAFLAAYEADLQQFGTVHAMNAKPEEPNNTFPVSMVPWESFESFHLHLPNSGGYLLPIFTIGKFYASGDRWMLPLAVQVHHGVCDGFHLCRFLAELRSELEV